jgi:DNA repair protein RecN (Recombination protein N)
VSEADRLPPDGPAAGRLLELTVADLALIEFARIRFVPGFNVLTGETGAGKSLLIDALGLVLGARADPGLVRHGAETARVEALFERDPEPLISVREVSAAGRSIARLDDEAVTAGRLASTVGPLVEIHGQHEQARLLDGRWQRELLDSFGGHAAERAAVAAAVAAWRENEEAIAGLAAAPLDLERRAALAEHEVAEIGAARLVPGEVEALRSRLEASRHGEAIAARGASVGRLLLGTGDGLGDADGSPGARDQVAGAGREIDELARLDPRFGPLGERLLGLEAELEDVGHEVRRLVETVDHDPAAIAELEARLSALFVLECQYGVSADALVERAARAAAEAERLRGLGAERSRRAAERAVLLAAVAGACVALSARRVAAAARLGHAVEAAAAGLGMSGIGVEVAVGRRPAGPEEPAVELEGDAVAFDASGADTVVFRIAPNPGEPARPLDRIASGGELSRLALAIEEVLATADATPTLVFDEIDSGIGGRSAEAVGRSLWALGRRHQVLCVTHLPQIAAYADAQFEISKRQREGRTVTEVARLDEPGRVRELAAMLGGLSGGMTVEASARELLTRADAWRARQVGRRA